MDDRDRVPHRTPWVPWAITAVALVFVAFVAYSIGAQHAVVDADTGRRVWVHPWFPGFWLFFLLFWVLVGGLRRMWWGWGYPYYPWRYGRYYRHPYGYDDERDRWEEWHRRAHGGGSAPGSGAPSNSSTPNRDSIT
jgi:hypothetical protein